MKKTIIVAIVTAALLATSGLALAQGWGRGTGMGSGPCMTGVAPMGPGAWGPGANLSAEQIQKMQTLRESFFKETVPLRNEFMTKQLELRTLWVQTNPDQEKILAKQKEINALKAQLQEKATKHRLDVMQVLTPEQRAQFQAFRGGFGYCPGPGYGMRGGFGPGRGMGMGMGMGYGPGPRW